MSTATIQHDIGRQCFTAAVDGQEAILQYRLFERPVSGSPEMSKSVDFTHTFVPPECRGKGLAEALVRKGLTWARQQDLEIEASCWYVAKFLRSR